MVQCLEFNGENYYVKKWSNSTHNGTYKLLFSAGINNWAVCGILTDNVNKCILKSVQVDREIGQLVRNFKMKILETEL